MCWGRSPRSFSPRSTSRKTRRIASILPKVAVTAVGMRLEEVVWRSSGYGPRHSHQQCSCWALQSIFLACHIIVVFFYFPGKCEPAVQTGGWTSLPHRLSRVVSPNGQKLSRLPLRGLSPSYTEFGVIDADYVSVFRRILRVHLRFLSVGKLEALGFQGLGFPS